MDSEFRPLEGRARWAVVGLATVIVSDILAIGSDWLEIELLNRVIDGESVDLSDRQASEDRQTGAAALLLVAWVATAVLFIRWFRAAYANLIALGQPNLRFKPGWAIGAWFVPFLNLWRPKQIANDIWRGSDPRAPAIAGDGWTTPVAAVITIWWAIWIASVYLGNFGLRVWFEADTPAETRRADIADLVYLVVDIVAACFAIAVVRKLTARQAERHRSQDVAAVPSGTIPEA